jgi:hypothetical protein
MADSKCLQSETVRPIDFMVNYGSVVPICWSENSGHVSHNLLRISVLRELP